MGIMMVWVNAVAILVSAYVFAYGLVRMAAIVLPRLLPNAPSPLPTGMAVSISVIGFCMVTGSPGPVVFGMILVAMALTRFELIATGASLHRLALLIAALLAGSVFITHEGLHVASISPYVLAAIAAAAVAAIILLLEHSEAPAKTVLVFTSLALIAAPMIVPVPYHVALDGALVLIGFAAFMHGARHVRVPLALGRAFTLPSAILLMHGVMVTLAACLKGL